MNQRTISALIVWAMAAQSFAASEAVTNGCAFSEIQQAIRTYTNDNAALHAVGLKYKDAKELRVSASAHAALIQAGDLSEFTNVLAGYREALLTGSRARRPASLMGLYLGNASSPAVASVLSNEIVRLSSGLQDESTDEYRRALLALALDHTPDLVVDSWLRRETESLLHAATNRSLLVHGRALLDAVSRALASRGDPMTREVVVRLRQLDGQYMEPYCQRYEWMYRIATATHPEETLQRAAASGDEILEHWCIRFIHQKRLTSMLPFAEQRSRETSSLTRDYYLHLIRDLRNPDQIRGPLGSRENPIYSSEQLAPPPSSEDSSRK